MNTAVRSSFGEPVVFHLEGQTEPITVTGIFSAAYQSVDVSGGVPVATVQPVLEVLAADVPQTPTEGDAVTVQGSLYLIVAVHPDGHGMLKLMLHKGASHETSTHTDP